MKSVTIQPVNHMPLHHIPHLFPQVLTFNMQSYMYTWPMKEYILNNHSISTYVYALYYTVYTPNIS